MESIIRETPPIGKSGGPETVCAMPAIRGAQSLSIVPRPLRQRSPLALVPLMLALIFASFAQPLSPVLRAGATNNPPANAPVGLHVVGNRLLDGANSPLLLRGVNRSGSEYACIQGWGFFDGPSDLASVQAIASWGANAVRIPLNEGCWLAINGAPPPYSGEAYQQAISSYVATVQAAGLVPILELHWSGAGTTRATGMQPMLNRDHSLLFWQQVAQAYRSNTGVLFDLHNEPYPDGNRDTVAAWDCWQHGTTATNASSCPGSGLSYQAAGMQELVNAVRATGAQNVIMLGGVQYSNALSRWLSYRPTDPTGNLVAAWHVYNFNFCNNLTCYNQQVAPVAASVPLVAGEIGEDTCGHTFIDPLMNWLDGHNAGYLAWTWNTWGGCGPVLITDYSGTPTAYGAGYRDHLRAIAPPSPTPTPSPSPVLRGPRPVISRDAPAYASGGYPAAYANDADYATVWRSVTAPSPGAPQWLAYDLSGIPAANRRDVVLAWYNDATSPYWQGREGIFYAQPRDYSIEVATGPAGVPPPTGWTTLATVAGNTYSGRAHALDLGTSTWVRFRVTATNGTPGNQDVAIQLDIHDASRQADSWLFLGDSITQEGMRHANITGAPWMGGNLAQLVGAATQQVRFPATVNGGTGGMTMAWAAQNIQALLAPFQGRYVAISFGTNDANINGPLQDAQSAAYYQSLLTVVDAVQARGLVAVVPTTPWGCASGGWLGTNAKTLNAYVAVRLWTDRPSVVRGPDLWTFYNQNPGLLRDCIHPTYLTQNGHLNGYEQYQRQWMEAIMSVTTPSTSSTPPAPSPSHTPTPTATATPQPSLSPSLPPSPSPSPSPSPIPTSPPAGDFTLYDNEVRDGFTDDSFGFSARNPCDPASFVSAPCGYTIAYTAWGGLNFSAGGNGFDTSPYGTLKWAMLTNGMPVTNFSVLFTDNTGGRTVIREIVLAPGDITAILPGGWVEITMSVARLNPANVVVSSIQIKNATSGSLGPVTIDDVRLTPP